MINDINTPIDSSVFYLELHEFLDDVNYANVCERNHFIAGLIIKTEQDSRSIAGPEASE